MPITPGSAGSGKAKEMKLVVVGSGGVGKSAITIRFVTSQFYDRGYNPTIEDSYRKQFVVDEEAVTLEILDTAGQEEYALMADQWYKFGHGFLLVYSITDRPTFDAVYGFHQDVLRVKDRPYVPCVVASNKCDLARLRAVGQSEGRDMAKSMSAPFIECSASDGVNIDVAFRELVKLVRKDERRRSYAARNQAPPSSSNTSVPALPGSRRYDPTSNLRPVSASPRGEYGLQQQQAEAQAQAQAQQQEAERARRRESGCGCVLM